MSQLLPTKKIIFLTITLLACFLFAKQASAGCFWSLYNRCQDMGNGWGTAAQESYCSGEKPNGATAKCCCGKKDTACCVKDRNGQITTDNLTQAECDAIDYAETTLIPNALAMNNRCFKYQGISGAMYIDVTPQSNSQKNTPPSAITDGGMQSLQFQTQIAIPGSELTGTVNVGEYDGSDKIKSNLAARYIAALYDYGLAVAAILAAIVLMGGGLLWLTSGGNDAKITKAKEMIIGSVSGLVILFFSWIILNTINPDLLKLKTISTGVQAKRSYLNCCDPETGPSSTLVEIKNGKTIAREGPETGKEVSCKSPGKPCQGNDTCIHFDNKYDCRINKICCECVNYLGFMEYGLPVSFMCKNDMNINDCHSWCQTWYTTGYTVEYYWGGSLNYTCESTLGFGLCESK